MHFLKALNATRGASFFDPGSSNGRHDLLAVSSAVRCARLGSLARKKNVTQVWINSSIYDTAIVKLGILLFSLRKYRAPLVRVFFHGGRFDRLKWLRYGLMKRFVLKALERADVFHFLSREQGEGFQKVCGQRRWELFRNFSSSATLLDRNPPGVKAFLFVGRLVREKGIREVVAAIDHLSHMGLRVGGVGGLEFWFAGGGPESAYLKEESLRRTPGTIRLFGHLRKKGLDEVYTKAIALLLPSRSEAFPYVIIEAMRAGLPIIACPTGAVSDLIKHNQNGFLVPVGDFVALAQAIGNLLEDEGLWTKMSNNNKEFFLRYLSMPVAEKYYEKLVTESTTPCIESG
ncbi:MAG: glycosyltransferase family 4 protein [Deltaproteobacteria bacterium]|nr:glycosyltransferase family 4 protein [Deltaproteobacteria bacterium]